MPSLAHTRGDLTQLEKELMRWRRVRKLPCAIPEELWGRAARLASKLGVAAVARTLGLNPTHLKRRVLASEPAGNSLATFVEFFPPTAAVTPADCIAECALEVDSAHGSRLRVVLKDIAPSSLALILRDFSKGVR